MGVYVGSLFDTKFSASKPLKKRDLTFDIDGHELTVIIKPESALKRSFEKGYYEKCDMYAALNNHLTRDEVIERDDPNLKYQAYNYRPEIGKDVPTLTDEEIEKRFQFVCNAYRLLENDSVVEAIVRFAEKKKNGTFYKKRYTRIFTSAIVSRDFYTFCVFGYAKSDFELEIRGDWVDFEKEINYVDKDFLSQYPDILSGEITAIEALKTAPKGKPKLCEFVYLAGFFSDSTYKVNLTEKDGVQYLGNTPVSSFKCLRKTKKGYAIEITAPAFEDQVGKQYGDFIVSNYYYGFPYEFSRYFRVLEDYTFSPLDDDLKEFLNSLDEYLAKNGISSPYAIDDWPKGLKNYSGKYTLEESLEVLLTWIEEILSITPQQIQEYIDNLPRSKAGVIKTNQNIILRTAPFYLPFNNKKVDYKGRSTKPIKTDSFDSIFSGGQPAIKIRTPMNHPKKNISFVLTIEKWNRD